MTSSAALAAPHANRSINCADTTRRQPPSAASARRHVSLSRTFSADSVRTFVLLPLRAPEPQPSSVALGRP